MLTFLHRQKTNAACFDFSIDQDSKRRLKYVLLVMVPFVAILAQAPFLAATAQAPTITVTSVTPASVCNGSSTPVAAAFTTSADFNAGNVFTAQLSDATGSFDSPTDIGTLSGTAGGTINATIPASTAAGTGYLIRIVATDPAVTSTNPTGFTIDALITADAGNNQIGSGTCDGIVTLEGNDPAPGTGLWSIVSDGTGTFSDPTDPASTFTGTRGTAYILRWTVTNGTCSSSDEMVVRFNTDPTPADAGQGQTVCSATTTTLTANRPADGIGKWTFAPLSDSSGGSFGNRFDPHSTLTGTAGQTYELQWTISTPCSSNSDFVNITFSAADVSGPSLTLSKKDVSSCGDGSDGILTGIGSGGTGTLTFDFTGGTQTAIENGLQVSDLSPGHYTMRVVDDASGCSAVQDTNLIQVPAPTIEVSTQGNVSGCDPTKLGYFTLRVLPRVGTVAIGGIKPYSFQIASQGEDIESAPLEEKSVPIIFSDLDVGSYQVRMTDSAGCVSNIISNITIGTDPALTIELSGYHHPSCLENDGNITVKAEGGSGKVYRYSISKDGGPSSPPQSSRIFSGLGPGEYVVTASDSRGCTATLTMTLKTNAPIITKSVTNVSACGASDGSITVRPSGGIRPIRTYSLSTDNGANFTVDQGTQTFGNLSAVNTYAVRVTDAKGCMSNVVRNITIAEPTGCPPAIAGSTSSISATAKNSLSLMALPNPTRTAFTLNLQSSSKEKVQIIVTDMFGKKLHQTTGSATQQYTFGREFASGMYIVQVIQGKETRTLKLVKGN